VKHYYDSEKNKYLKKTSFIRCQTLRLSSTVSSLAIQACCSVEWIIAFGFFYYFLLPVCRSVLLLFHLFQ